MIINKDVSVEEMKKALEAAAAAIDKVDNWSRDIRGPIDMKAKLHDAKFYTGSGDGWYFTVVDFSIEAQGFPKGSRGYDGAGRSQSIVLHLTRELAQRAVEHARKQNS